MVLKTRKPLRSPAIVFCGVLNIASRLSDVTSRLKRIHGARIKLAQEMWIGPSRADVQRP